MKTPNITELERRSNLMQSILPINVGSPSIKFALYQIAHRSGVIIRTYPRWRASIRLFIVPCRRSQHYF